MSQIKIKPAAFIDRDGTLIEEVNFLSRVEDLRMFPFTPKAIEMLKENGFLIIVVTNQSGIGRNIYGESDMNAVHSQIQKKLGASIDAFYFCPHLPCDGCECRKPGLGMIEAARLDFDIDMTRSWMIGDKKIDIETGFQAEIKTAMVRTGYGSQQVNDLERSPDIIAVDLLNAVEMLVLY
ncbi:MAG: HAD family hydrolase [Pyrinomonadaceae bacterium]